jgi:hypothetical protein
MTQHTFYINNGKDTVTIWADDWKSAINKFRALAPDVVFMTSVEMDVRSRKVPEEVAA